VDYFNGAVTRQTDRLDGLLGRDLLSIGDLILTEVLQGFDDDRQFAKARKLLTALTVVPIGGADIAIAAAQNFRALRKLGVTIRKTIGTLIATRCIESGYEILHSGRDFEPFAQYLGLRVVE